MGREWISVCYPEQTLLWWDHIMDASLFTKDPLPLRVKYSCQVRCNKGKKFTDRIAHESSVGSHGNARISRSNVTVRLSQSEKLAFGATEHNQLFAIYCLTTDTPCTLGLRLYPWIRLRPCRQLCGTEAERRTRRTSGPTGPPECPSALRPWTRA